MKRRFITPSLRTTTEPAPATPPADSSFTSTRNGETTFETPSPAMPAAPANSTAATPIKTVTQSSAGIVAPQMSMFVMRRMMSTPMISMSMIVKTRM